MADTGRGQPEEKPEQGSLLNELDTMYKKVSEDNLAEPGSSKDTPVRPEPDQPDLPLSFEGNETERRSSKKGSTSVARFFLFSVPIVLIAAFALFIWPTPYQYGALKQGGRIYLVKTNRLTNAKSYFYGGKWMNAPLPDPSGLRLPDPLSVKSSEDAPMPASEPSAAASKPEVAQQAAQKPAPPAEAMQKPEPAPPAQKAEMPPVVPKQKAEPVSAPAKRTGPPPAAAPVQETSKAPAKAVKEPVKEEIKNVETKPEPPLKKAAAKRSLPRKPYAVQIRAFQSREELRNFFADHRGEKDMHWAKVKVGNGTWYRVFIGRFGNQEEAKNYIRKNQLEAAYPGSFVQKAH